MRLINADTAKAFSELCFGDIFLQTAVKTLLDKTPTVNAVEVVRCKDCKAKHEYSPTRWFCGLTGMPIDEDDFCSFGEGKQNG